MKKISLKSLLFILAVLFGMSEMACNQTIKKEDNRNKTLEQKVTKEKHKVTFIELGSVRCIPCQKMQPIMQSIEETYPDQVKVVFYDVWTPEGKPYADKYGIKAIPTQVFLDENGKEYYRHKGFFPEEELIKVLKQKGVK
ncbi:MAG: thioredoxin family protein [Bacteroidota bacterium]|nr:thioredoxin family protein [Bacteroidota bacterium]